VCAVESTPEPGFTTMTGYLYDADGDRVAKGTISTMSCNPATNGFQFAKDYVLGPGGEELTTLSVASGTATWQRTNVYAGGGFIGTYDLVSGQPALHFHLGDPLGTRRLQVSGMLANLGCPEMDFQSLPYGDQLAEYPDVCYAADDSTPLHFTGQERDSESGNDYFRARYYGSSIGRFLSADPAGPWFANAADPQSWNFYTYVHNNPFINIDPTGLDCIFFGDVSGTIAEIDHGDTLADSQACANAPGGGGQWVDGYVDESQMDYNPDTDSWNVVSSDEDNIYYTTISQANPSCTTNCQTSFSSIPLDNVNSMLVAGSMSDFLQWLPANGVPGSRPNAQYPLDPALKTRVNNYCGPNGAGGSVQHFSHFSWNLGRLLVESWFGIGFNPVAAVEAV
jgi:RHS repeat-associated protein